MYNLVHALFLKHFNFNFMTTVKTWWLKIFRQQPVSGPWDETVGQIKSQFQVWLHRIESCNHLSGLFTTEFSLNKLVQHFDELYLQVPYKSFAWFQASSQCFKLLSLSDGAGDTLYFCFLNDTNPIFLLQFFLASVHTYYTLTKQEVWTWFRWVANKKNSSI